MKPATKHLLIGGGLGAGALAIGHTLWEHFHRGHGHARRDDVVVENERGEYGHHKHHHHHKDR